MTLQEALESIKDERIERCKKHNPVDILMIAFLEILYGYIKYRTNTVLCRAQQRYTQKYLKLENDIPSSDTILRVLARIDTKQLEKVFIEYARETFAKNLA